MKKFLLLGVLLVGACGFAQNPPSKKLLEFGWDAPRPSQLTTAQLENSIFQGVTFRSTAGINVIQNKELPNSAFETDIADLQKIKSAKLKDSFYLVNVNTSPWDWFDDTAWAATEKNFFKLARVAKEGGLRGILFDPEVYGFDLWAYGSQPQKSQHSFLQFEAQLFKRGQQTMQAFERAYPGITVLFLKFFGDFDLPDNPTYQNAHAALETDSSLGLFAAFAEGMLQAGVCPLEGLHGLLTALK